MVYWIQIDNDNRVYFSANSETANCIEVDAPAEFTQTSQYDWVYNGEQLYYSKYVPPEEEDDDTAPLEQLRADVDYLLMLLEE